jgi:phosphoserine phosphatase
MKIRLVLFDMDGVIYEGSNFWLELHQRFGTEKEGVDAANRYLKPDYDRLAEIVAGRLWKGKPAAIMYDMVEQRRYQPGVQGVFAFLRDNDIRSAIISSGPYPLALRAQRELGIDLVKANDLVVQDRLIQGEVAVMVPDGEKARVGQEVMEQMGVEPLQTAFIGDTDSDVELARRVGLAVAYNSQSQRLIEVCDYALAYGELPKFIEIIQTSAVR